MRLQEAKARLCACAGRPFKELLNLDGLEDLKTNKGNVGQILERLLGLNNSSCHLDFEDGELKTNKCSLNGSPVETMFIMQICRIIDELFDRRPFLQSPLFEKIRNLLYVPVCKQGETLNWMFLPCIHVNLDEPRFYSVRQQLESDYYHICDLLLQHAQGSRDGYIHTSSGSLIQVRSKDARPYKPIYSGKLGRYVSNKNHAFYFKKEFMYLVQSTSPDYPFHS